MAWTSAAAALWLRNLVGQFHPTGDMEPAVVLPPEDAKAESAASPATQQDEGEPGTWCLDAASLDVMRSAHYAQQVT